MRAMFKGLPIPAVALVILCLVGCPGSKRDDASNQTASDQTTSTAGAAPAGAPAGAAGAAYKVTIVFMGLSTWELGTNTATVMMPAVPTDTMLGDDDHHVSAHIPYILADVNTMPAAHAINIANKNAFQPAAHEGATYHYLPLHGEYIALEAANNPGTNTPLKYTNDATGTCPDKDSQTSMYWVSKMTKVKGSKQKKETKYFYPLPDPSDIAVRAILPLGALGAHVIKPGHIWDFAQPKPAGAHGKTVHTQALAQEVHWTFDAVGDPFVLTLFGYNGMTRRVAFTPQNGQVLIVVGNSPADETGPLTGTAKADEHYSVYHRAIAGNPRGLGPIPYPSGKECADQSFLFEKTLQPAATPAPPATFTGSATTTGGIPSGLNCSGNQWP